MAQRPLFDDTFYVVKARNDLTEAQEGWLVATRTPLLAIDDLRRAAALSKAGIPMRERVAEVFFIDPILRVVDGDLKIPPSALANELQDEYGHFEFISATAKRFYDRHHLPLPGQVIGTLKRSQLPRVLGTQLTLPVYEPALPQRRNVP